MPYLVISTAYVAGNFGKTTIVGGQDMEMDKDDFEYLKPDKKPDYTSSIGYWYVVKKPAKELIKELRTRGYEIHSQCANNNDMFWNLHKPLRTD